MYIFLSRLRLSSLALLALLLSACNTIDNSTDYAGASGGTYAAGSFIWHDLITHDMETARQFYSGLFGWTFEKTADREGQPYTLAKINGRYAAGILQLPRPTDGSSYSRWIGYMTVDNIDSALTMAHSSGGIVHSGSRDIGELGKVAAIEDAQSAVLGLIETKIDPSNLTLNDTNGAIFWNELLASDDSKAADFYSKLAGYTANIIERRNGQYIFLEADGLKRAGILQNPFDATAPIWLSYFAVSDPVVIVAKAQALGGKVLLAPSEDLREGTIALIQDPDGVILALQKWPL